MNRLVREPVLVTAFVEALVLLAVAFGIDMTSAQQAAILGVMAAVLPLVALIPRQKVTPVADPRLPDTPPEEG